MRTPLSAMSSMRTPLASSFDGSYRWQQPQPPFDSAQSLPEHGTATPPWPLPGKHVLSATRQDSLLELSGQAARAWGDPLKIEAESLNTEVFDLTARHTGRLFDALTGCGEMTIPLFSRALVLEGFQIPVNDGETFELIERFYTALKGNEPGFGKHAFQTGLRLLKLQVLYLESAPFRSGKLQRIDWSPLEVRDAYFKPLAVQDVREHLISEQEKTKFPYRWVNLVSPEPNDILRVAVEYNLHPMAIEDILKQTRQSAPRMRKYGEYYFIILPLMRLSEASKMMYSEYRSQADSLNGAGSQTTGVRVAIELECSRLCVFTSIAPPSDTVVSIVSSWQAFTTIQHTPARSSRGTFSEDQCNLSKLADTASCGNSIQRLFDKVAKSLQKDFSESRMANASQLTWQLIKSALEEYREVYEAFAARLTWCEHNSHSVRLDVDLMRLHTDMSDLLRELRPITSVVERELRAITSLVERGQKEIDIEEGVRVYVDAVCDELSRLVEDIGRAMDLSQLLREEIKSEKEAQKNSILFKLSLLAGIILPWQLLTSLYGMNFIDSDGKPVTPLLGEMALDRGFTMFWGIGAGMTCIFMCWWRCYSAH